MVGFANEMSDIGICTRALELCGCWFVCQRWRCMRVARVARIMNWKSYNMEEWRSNDVNMFATENRRPHA